MTSDIPLWGGEKKVSKRTMEYVTCFLHVPLLSVPYLRCASWIHFLSSLVSVIPWTSSSERRSEKTQKSHLHPVHIIWSENDATFF